MKAKTVKKHFRSVASSPVTGKPIMGGAFFMHDTVGLPLGMQILEAKKAGVTISLPEFVADAFKAGWNDETIAKTIKGELRLIGEYRSLEIFKEAGFLDDPRRFVSAVLVKAEGG